MKRSDLAVYAGLAAGGYLLYKWLASGASLFANTLASPIASAWVGLTAPGAPVPQGSIIFPDGSSIPAANVSMTWIGNALTFAYNGRNWQLQPHDANGNYPAILYIGA